jgi:hypothetical protein
MKFVNIAIPDPAYVRLATSAEGRGLTIEHYLSVLISELDDAPTEPAPEPHQMPSAEPQVPAAAEPLAHTVFPQDQLLQEILDFLISQGGSAMKPRVEEALFEKHKEDFETKYWSQLIGGGVPRWKKHIQFARNTARQMGLIKGPARFGGYGRWEITEKGRNWRRTPPDEAA